MGGRDMRRKVAMYKVGWREDTKYWYKEVTSTVEMLCLVSELARKYDVISVKRINKFRLEDL